MVAALAEARLARCGVRRKVMDAKHTRSIDRTRRIAHYAGVDLSLIRANAQVAHCAPLWQGLYRGFDLMDVWKP